MAERTLGRVLRAAGDISAAREALGRALSAFSVMGARSDEARTRALLDEFGAGAPAS